MKSPFQPGINTWYEYTLLGPRVTPIILGSFFDSIMICKIYRISYHSTATLGIMLVDDEPLFTTFELPWVGNTQNLSRIPFGYYPATRIISPRFGVTMKLDHVVGRTSILFHAGNTERDTKGCILLGMGFSKLHGQPAIKQSKLAMNKFRQLIEHVPRAEVWILDC